MPNPHVGDEGTEFDLVVTDQDNLPLDLTEPSTVLSMTFEKPDSRVTFNVIPAVVSGKNDTMRHIGTSGMLDVDGLWRYRGICEKTAGKWTTTWGTFTVDL